MLVQGHEQGVISRKSGHIHMNMIMQLAASANKRRSVSAKRRSVSDKKNTDGRASAGQPVAR